MKNLYKKLFEFRKLTGRVVKSKNNPFFKSKYSDLNSVIEATDPALEEVGLIYIDRIENYTLVSEIVDPESGESLQSITPLMMAKQDMQGLIGATTYARRVARMAVCGLMAVDDDGNSASGKVYAKPAQIKKITRLLLDTSTDASKFLSYYHVGMVKDLLEGNAMDAIKTLELKLEKMGGQDGK